MKKRYTSIDQLPMFLNADEVAAILGISRAGAYQLLHRADVPVIRVGKRMMISREGLFRWLEEQTQEQKLSCESKAEMV